MNANKPLPPVHRESVAPSQQKSEKQQAKKAASNPQQMPKMKAQTSANKEKTMQVENDELSANETAYLAKMDKLANRLAKDFLSKDGVRMTRAEIIAYSHSAPTAAEIRPIPRTWDKEVITNMDLWNWAEFVAKPHEELYQKSGAEAYATAVMNSIFNSDDPSEWDVPTFPINLCMRIDKKVSENVGLGLTKNEMTDLRKRVIGSFLFGRVMVPYLRPLSVRSDGPEKIIKAFDKALINAGRDKLELFTALIMQKNDTI